MALLGAPLARLCSRFVGAGRPGEFERRQSPDELGMGAANVQIGSLEEFLLVLPPEGVATTAADHSAISIASRQLDGGQG